MVILGVMFTAVIPNIRGTDPVDELEQRATTFAQIFTLASEYSLLNNMELGLLVEEESYRFLAFDGTRWVDVPENDLLNEVSVEEPWFVELSLHELPIDQDEQMSVSRELFEDFESESSFEDEEEPVYPQIFILSGGDITPFKMTFSYDDQYEDPIYFEVISGYTLPLKVEGPLYEEN